MHISSIFRRGDAVTPKGSCADSTNFEKTIYYGRVMTVWVATPEKFVAKEYPHVAFWSEDFMLTLSATRVPSPAETLLTKTDGLQPGDKVTPKSGVAISTDENSHIEFKRIVTVKKVGCVPAVGGKKELFTIEETYGIFYAGNFKRVHITAHTEQTTTGSTPKSVSRLISSSPKKSPQPVVPQGERAGSRKSIRKRLEKVYGPLVWHEGYLFYSNLKERIPDSPYRPKGKGRGKGD